MCSFSINVRYIISAILTRDEPAKACENPVFIELKSHDPWHYVYNFVEFFKSEGLIVVVHDRAQRGAVTSDDYILPLVFADDIFQVRTLR